MKRKIDTDERYPVYSLGGMDSYGGLEVEVTEEQAARWKAAEEAFDAAQDEMGDIYEAAAEVARGRARVAKAEAEARERAERAERSRQVEAANAKRREAAEKMIGTVYDADGIPVGEVSRGPAGLTARPIVQHSDE